MLVFEALRVEKWRWSRGGLLSHGVQCRVSACRVLSSLGLGCLATLLSVEDCEPGCAGGLWWCGDSQGSVCSLQG